MFAVFPAPSIDLGCLKGPKDATILNSLINLEREMICLLSSAESLEECLWGFTRELLKKEPRFRGP